MKRPFAFIVPFWGERFRRLFADYCLRSLFAPHNLPLLNADDGHRFIIATTAEDWKALRANQAFVRLERYASPLLIEINAPPRHTDPWEQRKANLWAQNEAQRKMLAVAHAERMCASLLSPDVIFSDRFVATLLRERECGTELLIMPALRQSQEDVLETLANSDLTIPPRELAELAVRHLHPELEAHLAGHPAQPFPCHIWRWHMPGGMLMHTLSGLPVLMNMAVLGADHLNCTEREMVENIYAWHNFCGRRVRIIHDSDECGLLSITPKGEDWGTKAPPLRLPWPLTALDRRLNLRAAMQIYCTVTRSTVRRDLFLVPIRFHQGITPAWSAAEAKIEEAFKSALAGYFDPLRPNEGRWPDQRTWSDIILDWGYARWRVRLSAIVSSISLHLRKMSANLAKSAVTGR